MQPSISDADGDAMLRLQKGDDLALNEIMERWQQPLANYIFRFIGDQQEAIDLTQQTFVKVYESRLRYKPTAKFSTWLFSIATNLCRNFIRWRKRHPTESIEEAKEALPNSKLAHLPSETGSPSDHALSNETSNAVREAISTLPEDLREAILLFEYQDLSYQEIARISECSPKAVETRLYRAREILRKKLERFLKGK